MNLVFMGAPAFAVPSLKALTEGGHRVLAAFTQPDKPKNRGLKFQPTPVKEYAVSQNIPVYQPETLKDGEALSVLRELRPELIVVAAYGKILPEAVLNLPPLGCVNVHSSLLPKYRGAAPINWAILNGETETGVTIMYMAKGVDTGDIISQKKTGIGPEEDAVQLYGRLSELGAALLLRTLPDIQAGTARRVPQDNALSCCAPMLSKELSPVDWSRPAAEIHNQVRGLVPWPSAVAEIGKARCKIWRTVLTGERTGKPAGRIIQADKKGLKIACGDKQVLQILELQPDGKKRMTAAAFLAGHPVRAD